ncbi:hypothetical protein CLTEP_18320 [Clostridium tepidiprofundi DSM 19306]|uniref:Phage-Barnase-EndoU-ColicinE5/D-RelE like nuclease 3 domain-containing protein n=1 Tax=Clostridium tepidiprofundi DSM 19306 TaxID=1121338 RepID=A0A151B3N0_9CLOT|nr:hypothetical protein [Clostridium tepidiprofundi]KYH34257.1 hypothetical protein CLTEP_18320 [Clostridium tepidiprofundi DSM 19306]
MEKVDLSRYHKVGIVTEELAKKADFDFTGVVYAAPGLIKHIKRRHERGKDALDHDIINNILSVIENIISSPDYIGKHPKKVGTSIEFVKKMGENLLVAVDVDLSNKYIYVSSLYPISEGKIKNRVNSGRFVKCTDRGMEEVAVTDKEYM